jgi:hypothetical protein
MWFLWGIGGLGVLLWLNENTAPIVYIFIATPLVWYGGRALFNHTKNKISTSLAEKRDDKEWRKNLARRAEEERVLGFVRNESMIQLMREQADNLIKQQQAGMHVERELMAMREKMLSFENAEFEDLIGKINTHL